MDGPARAWLGSGAICAALFALVAVAVQHSARFARFDESVMATTVGLRRSELTPVVRVITDLGSYFPVTLLMILLAALIGYRTRRLLEPLLLVAVVEVSESLVAVIKVSIEQARPPAAGMLDGPVVDYSFPSGHTASGTALWLLGALLVACTQPGGSGRRVLVATGGVVSVLIGLSRVYLGYHWLTDVLGGWLLAWVLVSLGMALIRVHPPSGPAELSVIAMNERLILRH